MTDVLTGNSVGFEECCFEWQDCKGCANASFVALHTPRAPGPILRRDVVQNWNPTFFGETCKYQVESWIVDQHHEVGWVLIEHGQEASNRAENEWQAAQDSGQAHDGSVAKWIEDIDTGSCELVSTKAGQCYLATFGANGFYHFDGMGFP